MNIEPLGQNCVVERIEEKLSETIVVPEKTAIKSQKGRIVAVGEEIRRKYADTPFFAFPPLEIDDIVLIPDYIGTEIKKDGKTYTILKYDELIARLI